MKNKQLSKNQKDYFEFLNTESEVQGLNPLTLLKLKNKLFPNPLRVFFKILGIHVIVGLASLAVCDQFGLNPFKTSQPLTTWFMQVAGHHVCMLLCGVFFMSSTYFLSNILLSLEQMETLKNHKWLQTTSMILLSVGVFFFFGAEFVLSYLLLWLVGAFLGSLLSVEGSYRLRKNWI